MIDLDWLDEQLEQALSDEVRCARRGLPAPAPAPARPAAPPPSRSKPPSRGRRPPVAVVPDRGEPVRPAPAPPPAVDARDVPAAAARRAVLDGREADARAEAARVLELGQQSGDPDAWTRYLSLRFRIVLEWGTEEELDELLDQLRARAYWFDEISWRGALALLLARLGKADEATREFDVTLSRGPSGLPAATWLEVAADLAEAATVLGDSHRASLAQRARTSRAA